MNSPTVSIIMSTYNDALYIGEAIESVLSQSFTDWEFIVVNDCSTDDSEEIINNYCNRDSRFIYIRNQKNKGQAVSLNTCIKLAKGRFIAVMDSDDIWSDTDKLKKQVRFLEENPSYGFVGCWSYIVENDKRITPLKYPGTDKAIREYMLIENCFMHDTIVMRKKLLEAVGGYTASLHAAHDYQLWLKLGTISKMHIIEEYMLHYRKNPKGITLQKYDQQLRETIAVIKQFKDFYPNYLKGLLLWNVRKYIPKNNNTITRLKTVIRNYLIKTN
jgi:glycosyltransferase involved in cell wall biosynthesis